MIDFSMDLITCLYYIFILSFVTLAQTANAVRKRRDKEARERKFVG